MNNKEPDTTARAERLKVLIVEDMKDDYLMLVRELRKGGLDLIDTVVASKDEFLNALGNEDWDVVVADYSIPGFSGLEALQLMQSNKVDIPFILVSGTIGEDVAVAAMKAGANDYVMKENLSRLAPAIRRELRDTEERRERRRAEESLRRSERRYRTLAENFPNGAVALYDYDLRYTLADGLGLTAAGLSPEMLEGKTIWEVWPKETLKLVEPDYWAALEGKETTREIPLGEKIYHSHNLPIRDESGRIIGGMVMTQDVTGQKMQEDQLRSSTAQLRALAGRLQNVREEERQMIAREVHDEFGQALTGFKMDTFWIRKHLQNLPANDEIKLLLDKTASMISLIDDTINKVRRLSAELRPGILDHLGLRAAIEWHAREFEKRSGIRCSVASEGDLTGLEPDRAIALFRIYQEALTNVARHASAKCVRVEISLHSNKAELTIKDDGVGMGKDFIKKSESLGIVGMRERALLLDGEFSISSGKNGGTSIIVRLPLKEGGVGEEESS